MKNTNRQDIKVVKWIAYNDVTKDMKKSIGGMGGWFKEGLRWKDYIENLKPEVVPYAEAIREAFKDKKPFGGDHHQDAPDGVPVFSDGTYGSFSYRAWGDIMAAIQTSKDNKDHHYMDYYMDGWGYLNDAG
jgi:hypothetical protein